MREKYDNIGKSSNVMNLSTFLILDITKFGIFHSPNDVTHKKKVK